MTALLRLTLSDLLGIVDNYLMCASIFADN